MTAGQPDSAYAALFREYVQRGAQATLAAVQSSGPALPAEQREQSLHTLEFALNLPEAWREARALLIDLAPKLDQAGIRPDYAPFLQRGIAQCQASGDAAGQAEMELRLGLLWMFMGRMEEARSLFQASAGHFAAAGDRSGQAGALNRWAYLDVTQQRLDSASQLVQEVLRLAPPGDVEATYAQFILGSLAQEQRDWTATLDHFQRALDGWRGHGDEVMVARSLTNLGSAQRGAGQIEAAIATFNEAIAQMEALDDPVNLAQTRLNLGNAYWALGQPQQALGHFLQAEPVFRRTHDTLRLARINNNMGVVYLQLGQLDQAQAALTAAVDLTRLVGDRRLRANALDTLGELHLRLGQPAAALDWFDQAWAELGDLAVQPGYASLAPEIQAHQRQARGDLDGRQPAEGANGS